MSTMRDTLDLQYKNIKHGSAEQVVISQEDHQK